MTAALPHTLCELQCSAATIAPLALTAGIDRLSSLEILHFDHRDGEIPLLDVRDLAALSRCPKLMMATLITELDERVVNTLVSMAQARDVAHMHDDDQRYRYLHLTVTCNHATEAQRARLRAQGMAVHIM